MISPVLRFYGKTDAILDLIKLVSVTLINQMPHQTLNFAVVMIICASCFLSAVYENKQAADKLR